MSACVFVCHRVREHVRGYYRHCTQTLNSLSRTQILSSRCTLQPQRSIYLSMASDDVVTCYLGYTRKQFAFGCLPGTICKEEEEVEDAQVGQPSQTIRGKIVYTFGGLGFLLEPEGTQEYLLAEGGLFWFNCGYAWRNQRQGSARAVATQHHCMKLSSEETHQKTSHCVQ